ncbi:hypothetical protein AB1484_22805 [Parafrankia sp. FMc6]
MTLEPVRVDGLWYLRGVVTDSEEMAPLGRVYWRTGPVGLRNSGFGL